MNPNENDLHEAKDEINSRYDALLQEYQESQAGPQASYEEYRDFVDQLERDRNRELDGLWLANQEPEPINNEGWIECSACEGTAYLPDGTLCHVCGAEGGWPELDNGED